MSVIYDPILKMRRSGLATELRNNQNKGWFLDALALRAAYPTASLGDFATVGGDTNGPSVWVWDQYILDWENTVSSGLVLSVFGRTGVVTAQAGDYSIYYDVLGAGAAAVSAHNLAFTHTDIALNTGARHAQSHTLNSGTDHSGTLAASQLPVSGNWALTGNLVINSGAVDADFTIKKLTSGDAFKYDAGADTISGYFIKLNASNTFVGVNAGNESLSGTGNQVIGNNAGKSITSGNSNVFIGNQAGELVTSGHNAVAIGYQALSQQTTASYGFAIGYRAAYMKTGSNMAIGHNAMGVGTLGVASDNIAIGSNSMYNALTALNCLAIGTGSLYSATSATSCIGIGNSAGYHVTTENGALFIDGHGSARASFADAQANSLVYGVMAVAGAASQSIQFNVASLTVPAAAYHYYGDPATDGTWRVGRSGTDLVIELRVAGTYVTKGSFTP